MDQLQLILAFLFLKKMFTVVSGRPYIHENENNMLVFKLKQICDSYLTC